MKYNEKFYYIPALITLIICALPFLPFLMIYWWITEPKMNEEIVYGPVADGDYYDKDNNILHFRDGKLQGITYCTQYLRDQKLNKILNG